MECILKGMMMLAFLGVTCAYRQIPPATRKCCARGDPHFYLFDGQAIHYQGNCTYQLAGTCDCPTFRVYITPTDCPYYPKPKTCVNLVVIQYNGQIITMPSGGPVVPAPGFHSGYQTSQSGFAMKFESDEGFIVEYNGVYDVCVTIPSDYYGKMCGICGNADGIANDLVTSDGVDVSGDPAPVAADKIGDSWQIDTGDGCNASSTPPVPDPVITANMDKKECNFMINAAQTQGLQQLGKCAERFPHLVRKHLESCVYDVAAGGTGCHILAAFVEDCREAGVTIPSDWRAITRCPLRCPEGMVYSANVLQCPNCHRYAPTSPPCDYTQREGCVCRTGTYRCRGRCIALPTVGTTRPTVGTTRPTARPVVDVAEPVLNTARPAVAGQIRG